MARPIELGLVLDGEDAREFNKYRENPTITEKSLAAMREALRRINEREIVM